MFLYTQCSVQIASVPGDFCQLAPSAMPSGNPSSLPSMAPSTSSLPSMSPSVLPSLLPSSAPSCLPSKTLPAIRALRRVQCRAQCRAFYQACSLVRRRAGARKRSVPSLQPVHPLAPSTSLYPWPMRSSMAAARKRPRKASASTH
jgi:hypothetical protein